MLDDRGVSQAVNRNRGGAAWRALGPDYIAGVLLNTGAPAASHRALLPPLLKGVEAVARLVVSLVRFGVREGCKSPAEGPIEQG